ncbi:Gfo/Idh/MocA family protein [Methanococcoides methylutens]|uniref:Gfo/Idh/MocA family protein n=1 Tax=Methanococcoides methylutens TaxID=2226 RepID=UPI004043A605
MMNIGVIGLGYWGPNYVRIINELNESIVEYCCDLDPNNLNKVNDLSASTKTTTDYMEMAKNPNIDAVVITTPINTHFKIAKDFLLNGKHVLIEKPFTNTSKEAMELIKIAEEKNLILMVGHVYAYNPGVQKLKEVINEGIGDLYYVRAERMGLGPIRKHANALWDLGTHDISIATYLFDSMPESVSAEGVSYIQANVEDVAFLTLKFPNNVIYNIHSSWFAPEKIRKTTAVGSSSMIVFDDVNKSETIKIYDRSIDKSLLDSSPEYSDHQSIVSVGDIHIPLVEQSEPLKNQVKHFLECISKNKQPITDGYAGFKVIKILEAAEESLQNNGRRVQCQ